LVWGGDRYWEAQIKIDGKTKHLGHFKREEDAARAYDEAARQLFGKFALFNEIGEERHA